MPLETFPPMILQGREDSSKFSRSSEDPSHKTDTDAGIVYSRPRFTRRPRKTFETGFTEISQVDYAILEQFWDEVKGCSNSFLYTDPSSGVEYTVRFKEQWKAKYVGVGPTFLWNVDGVVMEEV